jgi:hypothetical protein
VEESHPLTADWHVSKEVYFCLMWWIINLVTYCYSSRYYTNWYNFRVLCICRKHKGHQLSFSDLISCLWKCLSGRKLLMRVPNNFNLELIGRKWAQNP